MCKIFVYCTLLIINLLIGTFAYSVKNSITTHSLRSNLNNDASSDDIKILPPEALTDFQNNLDENLLNQNWSKVVVLMPIMMCLGVFVIICNDLCYPKKDPETTFWTHSDGNKREILENVKIKQDRRGKIFEV